MKTAVVPIIKNKTGDSMSHSQRMSENFQVVSAEF